MADDTNGANDVPPEGDPLEAARTAGLRYVLALLRSLRAQARVT